MQTALLKLYVQRNKSFYQYHLKLSVQVNEHGLLEKASRCYCGSGATGKSFVHHCDISMPFYEEHIFDLFVRRLQRLHSFVFSLSLIYITKTQVDLRSSD